MASGSCSLCVLDVNESRWQILVHCTKLNRCRLFCIQTELTVAFSCLFRSQNVHWNELWAKSRSTIRSTHKYGEREREIESAPYQTRFGDCDPKSLPSLSSRPFIGQFQAIQSFVYDESKVSHSHHFASSNFASRNEWEEKRLCKKYVYLCIDKAIIGAHNKKIIYANTYWIREKNVWRQKKWIEMVLFSYFIHFNGSGQVDSLVALICYCACRIFLWHFKYCSFQWVRAILQHIFMR